MVNSLIHFYFFGWTCASKVAIDSENSMNPPAFTELAGKSPAKAPVKTPAKKAPRVATPPPAYDAVGDDAGGAGDEDPAKDPPVDPVQQEEDREENRRKIGKDLPTCLAECVTRFAGAMMDIRVRVFGSGHVTRTCGRQRRSSDDTRRGQSRHHMCVRPSAPESVRPCASDDTRRGQDRIVAYGAGHGYLFSTVSSSSATTSTPNLTCSSERPLACVCMARRCPVPRSRTKHKGLLLQRPRPQVHEGRAPRSSTAPTVDQFMGVGSSVSGGKEFAALSIMLFEADELLAAQMVYHGPP